MKKYFIILFLLAFFLNENYAQSSYEWVKIVDSNEMPASYNVNAYSYDRTNNLIYSLGKNNSDQYFQVLDLNTNQWSTLSANSWPSELRNFLYDPLNNRIVCWRSGTDNVYEISVDGGSFNKIVDGSYDASKYHSRSFWNPLSNSFGLMNGYGFGTMNNWIYEVNSTTNSWQQVRGNTNDGIPPRSHISIAPNLLGDRIYTFGGNGNMSGQQNSCSLTYWYGTPHDYCWARGLWELNLVNYSYSEIIPLDDPAINTFGTFTFDFDQNTFYIIGGRKAPTNSDVLEDGEWTNKLLKFNPTTDNEFIEVSVIGDIPPEIGGGQAYYDGSLKRIIYLRSDGVWILNLLQSEWNCHLTISENLSDETGVVLFGQDSTATDGIDAALGESELPPIPPSGAFDVRFVLPNSSASLIDFRNFDNSEITWDLKFQPGSGGYPITINWDPNQLPNGSVFMKDPFTGTLVNVDMKSTNSYSVTNASINHLQIIYKQYLTSTVNVFEGWNLISMPLNAVDMDVSSLFPTATSQAYEFTTSYNPVTSLLNGKGYWLKFGGAEAIEVQGLNVNTSINVQEGWNIIGPFENDVNTSQITTNPTGIITSQIYGYNGGYSPATLLESGKGYWVKTSQAGTLMLNALVNKSMTNNSDFKTDKFSAISLTDKQNNRMDIYLTGESINSDKFSLPPIPPQNAFDFRFLGDKLVESIENGSYTILFSSNNYPLTLSTDDKSFNVYSSIDGKLIGALTQKSPLQIFDKTNGRLILELLDIPQSYSVSQNYPNPFNPTTNIKFTLPEDSQITLKIFNTLGQEIFNVQKVLTAGEYSEEFDFSTISSGVYFYQFSAKSKFSGAVFNQSRKMILLK